MIDDERRLTEISIAGKVLIVDEALYDHTIVKAIRSGGYESGERAVLRSFLAPGDRVIEIGTAIGLVAMAAADIVGDENVFCFEANPQLIRDSERNFARNDHKIRVNNKILLPRERLSTSTTTSIFYIHREFWASSLVEKPGTTGTCNIQNYGLEDAIAQFQANAVICDIEGGEIDLLSSANLSDIDKILLEIHYWAGRSLINKMLRRLINSGFSIDFDLSARSIVVLKRDAYSAPPA